MPFNILTLLSKFMASRHIFVSVKSVRVKESILVKKNGGGGGKLSRALQIDESAIIRVHKSGYFERRIRFHFATTP